MAPPRTRRGKVHLPNATVYDSELSYRALGLLAAMLARPQSASFDMRELASDPRRPGREGRDALLTAAKELRDHGYVHTFRVKLGGRRGVRTETVVSPEPITNTEARAIVDARSGSDLQKSETSTPVTQAPVDTTPAQPTVLPTEGHSLSLRSENPIVHRAPCPHGCDVAGWIQEDETTVAPCPIHRRRRAG